MKVAISIIGVHNAGKTTFLEGLIKSFRQKGLKVGVLKSSKEDQPYELPLSDTARLRKAGAKIVGFWGKEWFVSWQKALPKEEFTFWLYLFQYFSPVDLVLVEGLKGINSLPKIEVIRKDQTRKPFFKKGISGLIGLVSDYPLEERWPCWNLNNYNEIRDFILQKFPPRIKKAELIVDGQVIGLTSFVEKALWASVGGFIQTLRGVKKPQEILLRLRF